MASANARSAASTQTLGGGGGGIGGGAIIINNNNGGGGGGFSPDGHRITTSGRRTSHQTMATPTPSTLSAPVLTPSVSAKSAN